GEYGLRELEAGLAAELLAASLHPDPFGRLSLARRYEEDVGLRDRLQQHLEQARVEKQALGHSLGWFTRTYTLWWDEQMERQKAMIEAERARGQQFPGRAWDFRATARRTLKPPDRSEVSLMLMAMTIPPLVTWPLLWVVWSFVMRGGLSFRLMGLSLVRPDGR